MIVKIINNIINLLQNEWLMLMSQSVLREVNSFKVRR